MFTTSSPLPLASAGSWRSRKVMRAPTTTSSAGSDTPTPAWAPSPERLRPLGCPSCVRVISLAAEGSGRTATLSGTAATSAWARAGRTASSVSTATRNSMAMGMIQRHNLP